MNKKHRKLNSNEIKDICNTASKAWEKTTPSATSVNFTWQGAKYHSRLEMLRIIIETPEGELVAVRQFKPKPGQEIDLDY